MEVAKESEAIMGRKRCKQGLVLAGTLLLLGACVSQEELARSQHDWCVSLGTAPGTAEYLDCRYRAMEIYRQERAERARGMRALGQQLIKVGEPQPIYTYPQSSPAITPLCGREWVPTVGWVVNCP